jgi:hypothetical protein
MNNYAFIDMSMSTQKLEVSCGKESLPGKLRDGKTESICRRFTEKSADQEYFTAEARRRGENQKDVIELILMAMNLCPLRAYFCIQSA